MSQLDFNQLLELNCFSEDVKMREHASDELERNYGCEIKCIEMSKSVIFAHHARGCTIAAAKLCDNVIIYQNVTIGSNLKYNKTTSEWENVGNPILANNVIVADGAKILGPVVIGENTVVAAGSIITKDIPANSIAYGINQFKEKDLNYDYLYNDKMISGHDLIKENQLLIEAFKKRNK